MKIANVSPTERQTKYATVVYDTLKGMRHATNSEILIRVRKRYPDVSATAIHRVTSRLKARKVIGCAPKPSDGSERYDFNPEPHHHFMCTVCGSLCDVEDNETSRHLVDELKKLSEMCAFVGTLTLGGVCKKCVKTRTFYKKESQ